MNRRVLERCPSGALRIDPWRIFYRVEGEVVTIELIRQKKGNVLLIGGKEFKL